MRSTIPVALAVLGVACVTLALQAASLRRPGPHSLRAVRESLAGALRESSEVLVVTPPSETPLGRPLERAVGAMIECLTGEGPAGRVEPADHVSPRDLQTHHLILIGSPGSHPLVAGALGRLPVHFGPHAIRFLDDRGRIGRAGGPLWGAAEQANMTIRAANPYAPRLGMLLFTAPNDRVLLDHLWNLDLEGDYLLRIGDRRARWGSFSTFPGLALSPNGDTETDRLAPGGRTPYEASLLRLEVRPYRIAYPPSLGPVQAIQKAFEPRATALLARLRELAPRVQEPRLAVYAYPDLQTKGELTGDLSYIHGSSAAHQIHTLLDARFPQKDLSPELAMATREWYGFVAGRAIRAGLPVAEAKSWHGIPLERWEARLLGSGLLLGVRDLLNDARFRRRSPLIAVPSAASLCRYLIEEYGIEKPLLLGRLAGDSSPAVERILGIGVRELERGWRAALARDRAGLLGEFRGRKGARGGRRRPQGFLAGVRFEHSWRLETGVASRVARRGLRSLRREIGAGWVALAPRAWTASPDDPRLEGFPPPPGMLANGIPDGALEECIHQAREQGLEVFLEPRLAWLEGPPPGGGRGRPGLSLPDEGAWKEFFGDYGDFILHYALLAELHHVGLLSIGAGLGPAAESRTREWEGLIRRVRRVYHGPILYSAADPGGLARLSFLDRLDLVGVQMRVDAGLGGPGMGRALEACAAAARRSGRDLVVTTLRPPGGTRGVHALSEALERLGGAPWLAGVFFWRFQSDPDRNLRPSWGTPPPAADSWNALRAWFRGRPGKARRGGDGPTPGAERAR